MFSRMQTRLMTLVPRDSHGNFMMIKFTSKIYRPMQFFTLILLVYMTVRGLGGSVDTKRCRTSCQFLGSLFSKMGTDCGKSSAQ